MNHAGLRSGFSCNRSNAAPPPFSSSSARAPHCTSCCGRPPQTDLVLGVTGLFAVHHVTLTTTGKMLLVSVYAATPMFIAPPVN